MEAVDGRQKSINEFTDCELSLKNIPYSSFFLQPFVLPKSGVDIILGMNFLINNKILFDFGNKVIVIENL